MWTDKLNEIKIEEAIYNEKVNNGASEEEIEIFNKEVKEKIFEIGLPLDYLNFLRKVNGIEFNGYIIYGIDECYLSFTPNQKVNGLIYYNYSYDIMIPNSVILGETEGIWYIYDNSICKYIELNSLSNEKLKEYDSFDLMLDSVLEESLI